MMRALRWTYRCSCGFAVVTVVLWLSYILGLQHPPHRLSHLREESPGQSPTLT